MIWGETHYFRKHPYTPEIQHGSPEKKSLEVWRFRTWKPSIFRFQPLNLGGVEQGTTTLIIIVGCTHMLVFHGANLINDIEKWYSRRFSNKNPLTKKGVSIVFQSSPQNMGEKKPTLFCKDILSSPITDLTGGAFGYSGPFAFVKTRGTKAMMYGGRPP